MMSLKPYGSGQYDPEKEDEFIYGWKISDLAGRDDMTVEEDKKSVRGRSS